MRGVHDANDEIIQEGAGSSPHARGPLKAKADMVMLARIIPACAGSTILAACSLASA